MEPRTRTFKTTGGVTGILTGAALYVAPMLGMTPEQIETLKGMAPEIIIVVVAILAFETGYKAWRDHKASLIEIAKIQAGQPPAVAP